MERKLNVDVARSIADLRDAIGEFSLRRRLYQTLLQGRGLDFESYRTFTPEDDASNIDWKASKRSNKLLVKEYSEEKNTKVLFVIDVGEHMVFGSTNKLKCEYAAELTAALADLIIESGNKIGFLLFSNKIVRFIPPEKGSKIFNLFVNEISSSNTYGGASNLKTALDFLMNYADKSVTSVIFVSDFLKIDKSLDSYLSFVGSKFETMALMIKDPLDISLPDVSAEIVIEDPESGEQILMNPKIAKRSYDFYTKQDEENTISIFNRLNIDFLNLRTDKPFIVPLSEFLKSRVRSSK